MKIYLVMAGNKYEGLQPICACKTLSKAEEELNNLNNNDSFYSQDKLHEQYDSFAMGMELLK